MKKKISAVFPCLLSTTFTSQERIDLDRPDQTESSAIVPLNYFQMEAGYVYEQINNNENSQQMPSILFKYGITKNTELGLITEFDINKSFGKTQNQFQPLTIGFKTHLIE